MIPNKFTLQCLILYKVHPVKGCQHGKSGDLLLIRQLNQKLFSPGFLRQLKLVKFYSCVHRTHCLQALKAESSLKYTHPVMLMCSTLCLSLENSSVESELHGELTPLLKGGKICHSTATAKEENHESLMFKKFRKSSEILHKLTFKDRLELWLPPSPPSLRLLVFYPSRKAMSKLIVMNYLFQIV